MIEFAIEPLVVEFTDSPPLRFDAACWSLQPERPVSLVIGGNGVGKTTLLDVISGFVLPTSGAVRMSGTKVSGLSPRVAGDMGILRSFQVPLVCAELTVEENVRLPLFRGRDGVVSRPDIRVPLRDLADALQGRLNASPAELSFGQRRLVELTRISIQLRARSAILVLLDEPLSGLDDTNRRVALELVAAITRMSIPVLWVEHNLSASDCDLVGQVLKLERTDDSPIRVTTLRPNGVAGLI